MTTDTSPLFSILSTEFRRYIQSATSQADRQILSFPPGYLDRLGHAIYSNLAHGGISTFVVSGTRNWNPATRYFQTCRDAARKGCSIERLFLIPHKHLRHDSTLKRHVNLDSDAGIITHILYVGELISTFALPMTESLDFGLWDDSVACIGLYGGAVGGDVVSEWRVTTRPEDLQHLRAIIEILKTQAPYISTDPIRTAEPVTDLEEPMITTAPLAHELASVLCQGDHVSQEDCSWYHSIWQYLRIFNMVSTPTWHTDFFLNSIGDLARAPKDKLSPESEVSRVLISGTADYSMLAHVLSAYSKARVQADITVVDLCETPLFLCRWYAKFARTPIKTLPSDVLNLSEAHHFDVITTDAFLTRFSPEERPQIVSHWYRLLRKGGAVVTTVRLEPGFTGEMKVTTPEQAERFRAKALQEARRWQGFLRLTPEEIAADSFKYAQQMVSYSFRSEAEVRQLFADANFDLRRFDVSEVPGEMAATIYVELVAVKI